MMRIPSVVIAAGLAVAPLAAFAANAPTTAPAAGPGPAPSNIEVRAMEEFNRGQYALALPMLQEAVKQEQSQPDRVNSLQENIRVCQRNLAAPAAPDAAAAAAASGSAAGAPVQVASATVAPSGIASGAVASSVTPSEAAGVKTSADSSNPSVGTPIPGPLTDSRKPHAPPIAGQVQEMEIKELGNFDYDADKGGHIPADVMALSGSKVRLNGYMIPMDQAESITEFALVPSLFSCCMGQPPQIQHTIVVHVPKGKAVTYYPDEITVEGTLKVDEKKEDGFIVSIFEVETTSVKPAAK